MLRKQGYDVLPVSGHSEARALLDNNVFDLLIADITLPYIAAGFDLIAKTRQEYDLKNGRIPILAMMVSGDSDFLNKASETGIDDYLKKPFFEEEFILRVKRLLKDGLRRTSGLSLRR